MRTMPPAICSVIALSLLIAIPTPVLAQANNSEYEAQLRRGWDDAAPGLGALVVDAPFSAEAITTWQPRGNSERSEWRATARYYRDRAGRVRVEQVFAGRAGDQSPQRVILAPDPASRTAYVMDCVGRTASELPRSIAAITVGGFNRLVVPVSMTRFISFSRPQISRLYYNGALDEESLGQRAMVGIQATGTGFNTTLPIGAMGRDRPIQIADERWVSPELQLLVWGRTEDSEIGIVEHRLTQISRADPPAELFEVPADYSVTAPVYPLRFDNPYAPETWHNRPGLADGR